MQGEDDDTPGEGSRSRPRRAAAKKAAQKAAEQLDSSSSPMRGHEDEEFSFGEPSRSKPAIKFRYGKKNASAKSHSSPSKSSPLRSDMQRSGSSPTSRSARHAIPQMSSISRKQALTPSDRSTRSRRDTDSLTPLSDSDNEGETLETLGVQNYSSVRNLASDFAKSKSGGDASATSTYAHQSGPKINRKRSRSRSRSDGVSAQGDISTLTPLSSPEPDEPDRLSRGAVPPHFRRKFAAMQRPAVSEAFSLPVIPTGVGSVPMVSRFGQSSVLGPSPSSGSLIDLTIDDDDGTWSIESLGSLVWVRITPQGDVLNGGNNIIDSVWWPGKLIQPYMPLRVLLFGESPLSTNRSEVEIHVSSPSPANILSMLSYRRVLRFNELTYSSATDGGSAPTSPRKKRRTEPTVFDRWKEARDLMLQADQDDNDGLPHMLSAYASSFRTVPSDSPARTKGSNKDKGREVLSAEFDVEVSNAKKPWRPPPHNPSYDVPGELLLARESRRTTQYWPAKIIGYIPPQHEKEKPKYDVQFYDGKTKRLEPDMFFNTMDKGFRTCQMGEDKYNYGMDDGEPAHNTNTLEMMSDSEDHDILHAPSSPSAALAADGFTSNLPIKNQFAYVKPVLLAILRGEYGPVMERHDAFMRSAASRQEICNSATARGDLSGEEVEELDRCIRHWMRRNDKRDLGLLNGKTAPPPLSDTVLPNATLQQTEDHMEVEEQQSKLPTNQEMCDEPTDSEPGRGLSGPSESPREPTNTIIIDEELNLAEGIKIAQPRVLYKDLEELDKITYCTNILLPEAVLQLLLWRSNNRTTHELLSPEEEKHLHEIAELQAEETYWVHDIVRMKRAVDGKMLPQRKRAQPDITNGGGTRSRPQRR